MKRTTIDWAPLIPNHWDVVRLKDIARLQSGDSITSDKIDEAGGAYPVYGGNGLRGYTDTFTNEGEYILIGRQGALCGNINYARNRFFASEHAVVVYPFEKHESITWLGETLKITNLNRLSASAAQPGLAVCSLNFVKIPYPPQNERAQIGYFLDAKLAAIDLQVTQLEKKGKLYERLKTATISRAVTHGLDDKVCMKDSGVEWIGRIPEHWKVSRLKNHARIVLGKMIMSTEPLHNNGEYTLEKYLKARNIGWLEVSTAEDEVDSMWFNDYEKSIYKLHDGDIVMNEGDDIGKVSLWHDIGYDCYIQNSVNKITPTCDMNPAYLAYFLYHASQQGYFWSIVTQISIAHLTKEKLSFTPILCPPFSEQQAIAAYLDKQCAKIDAAKCLIEKQVAALKRLKRALVHEVITGQRPPS